MYDNIGRKIKILAGVMTWIGILAALIGGVCIIVIDDDLVVVGLLVMVVGGIVSWISSFVLYGFGQLIENSDILVRMNTKGGAISRQSQDEDAETRNAQLKNLFEKGLITEEEYRQKINDGK